MRLLSLAFCVLLLSAATVSAQEGLLDEILRSYASRIPALRSSVGQRSAQVSSEVVNRIVGRGFTDFKQQAMISELKGVSDSVLDRYIDHLAGTMELPTQYRSDFKETMQQIVWMDRNTWSVFNVMFARNSGGECKYVCIMARHDDLTSKTEWLIADIKANFKLADDLLVIRSSKSSFGGLFSSSRETIQRNPRSITNNELTVIFEFFQLVAFERFAELRSISVPRLGRPKALGFSFAGLVGGVQSGLNLWTSAVSAFKSSKSSTIKNIIQSKGWSHFSQRAQLQKLVGMRDDYFDTYISRLQERLQVPASSRLDFKYAMEDMAFVDKSTWVMNSVMFKTNQGGNIRFVSIIGGRDDATDKLFMLMTDITTDFKLGDDLMVINKAKSSLGGLFSSEKDVTKKMPRDLTPEDLAAAQNFFFAVAFKGFADNVGLQLQIPQI